MKNVVSYLLVWNICFITVNNKNKEYKRKNHIINFYSNNIFFSQFTIETNF